MTGSLPTPAPWSLSLSTDARPHTILGPARFRQRGAAVAALASVHHYGASNEQYGPEQTANAFVISAAADLLNACQNQHDAIDWLMARLITVDPDFRPTRAPIWPAVVTGHAAIAKALGAQPVPTEGG